MAINMTLRVTPEQLKQQSIGVENAVEEMVRRTQELVNLMDSTMSYWKGEAGDAYRNRLFNSVEEANAIFTRLRSYSARIQQMADIYTETEESNKTLVSINLKSDIVLR